MPSWHVSDVRGFTVSATGVPIELASIPDATVEGRLLIWFDGYLSNTPDLAEVYRLWATDAPRHLRGDFAAAIFDADAGRILLLHDELGLKPLFWSVQGQTLWFGTRLEALRDLAGYSGLDEDYIADYISAGEPSGARTPYRGISRLLPGEALVWDGVTAKSLDVWTLDQVEPTRLRPEQYPGALRARMTDAILAATAGKSRVFCQLSGGLDSSSVVALATRALSQPIEAVSVVYPKSYAADERAWMRIVLDLYPVKWHQIDGDACLPFNGEADRALGEPNELCLRPLWDQAYARVLAEGGADVMLTGEGGDNVLLGDHPVPYFLADRLLAGRWRGVPAEAGRWAGAERGRRSVVYGVREFIAKPIFRRFTNVPNDFQMRDIPWLTKAYRARMDTDHRGGRGWLPRSGSIADSFTLQRLVMMARIVSTMEHQWMTPVPIRHPLMDLDLVRFVLSMDWEHKISATQDRLVQRAAMRGILPEATRTRETKGGSSQNWIDGLAQGRAWYERLTDAPRIAARGYADLAAWRTAAAQARIARTTAHMFFDRTAALEMWLQSLETHRDPKPALVSQGNPA